MFLTGLGGTASASYIRVRRKEVTFRCAQNSITELDPVPKSDADSWGKNFHINCDQTTGTVASCIEEELIVKLTLNYPPIWLAGFMALAWLIAEVHAPFGDNYLWIGRIIIGVSLAIMVWAAFAFWRARTTIVPHEAPNALVATGPFQFSRNPIYLADLLIVVGWSVSMGSPGALALLVPFYFVLLHLFILPEEGRLAEHLGENYVEYQNRVRRWI